MKNNIVMMALASLSLPFSLDANAADYSLNGLSLSTSIGILSGKAHEYVYHPATDSKLSQLYLTRFKSQVLEIENYH